MLLSPRQWRIVFATFTFLVGFIVGGKGRRLLYRHLLKFHISNNSEIGNCFLAVNSLKMAELSRIGHFTIIRNMESVILEKDARLGTFNWVFGQQTSKHFAEEKFRKSVLLLEEGASITSRHIIDCTDSVTVGKFSTVAGFRSQILTHAIDIDNNRQACSPVVIGEYCFIGTGTIILKGAIFPDNSVLGAGSLYTGTGNGVGKLYAGVPAKPVKSLSADAKYMNRTDSHVL